MATPLSIFGTTLFSAAVSSFGYFLSKRAKNPDEQWQWQRTAATLIWAFAISVVVILGSEGTEIDQAMLTQYMLLTGPFVIYLQKALVNLASGVRSYQKGERKESRTQTNMVDADPDTGDVATPGKRTDESVVTGGADTTHSTDEASVEGMDVARSEESDGFEEANGDDQQGPSWRGDDDRQ